MFKNFKIVKLHLNNETWFFAKENLQITKIKLSILWSSISIFLFITDYKLIIILGYLLIFLLPNIYLPFYTKIKPILGLDNPTRNRSIALNLIKLRKEQTIKK